MKNLFVVALLAVIAVTVWARPDEEHYTDEFDSIDITEVVENPRLFNNYYNCFKTGEKCPRAGAKIRELLPDALQNKCAKCTEVQKKKARELLHYILKNDPEKFLELEKIHDKDRKYRQLFAKELADEGITLPE